MSFAVSVFANLFTYIIGKKGEYMVKKISKYLSCGVKMRKNTAGYLERYSTDNPYISVTPAPISGGETKNFSSRTFMNRNVKI